MNTEIAAELNRIAKQNNGSLTPDALLKEASDPSSPLHDRFDWDDTEAAHKWRIQQARDIIRKTTLVVKVGERSTVLPAFVQNPDKPKREQGYISTPEVKKDREVSHGVLVGEFGRAAMHLARARKLAEFFNLQGEVQEVELQVASLIQQVRERAQATMQ